ncbi:MAG TPA: polysaccharide deacetylase family protein [Candidatus Dormibacteraeota bacterium]|jgi:peptidoglycan/xylan/chitin deacetylase (PgdA/CDA1 family)|nr:polysaccharide deacetylase family protein [Candidatus Dormibacteraeota bacterium]
MRIGKARLLRRTTVAMAAALLLAGCGGQPAAHVQHRPSPTPTPDPARVVTQQADQFMQLFEHGDYEEQWSDLSDAARAEWPSETARTAMLTAKFQGMQATYSLGTPVGGAAWASGEDLDSVSGLWRVPVTVSLQGGAPQVADTGSAYQNLDLYLTPPTGTGADEVFPQVVGEGPASLDAPVLAVSGTPRTVQVPILMYHDVNTYPNRAAFPSEYAYQLQYGLTCGIQEFQQQMGWLHSNGFHAISLVRLADAIDYGLPLPDKPLIITFDDGYYGPYVNATPVLRQDRFAATFFLPSGYVNWINATQHYMSWPELQQLEQQGFWVEDHTRNHVAVFGLGAKQLRTQIVDSKEQIESRLDTPVQFFAYPGGWPFPSANEAGPQEQAVFSVLHGAGYQFAVTDQSDPSDAQSGGRPYQLPRIRVAANESIQEYASSLSAA